MSTLPRVATLALGGHRYPERLAMIFMGVSLVLLGWY
jgi:hypothetical protein